MEKNKRNRDDQPCRPQSPAAGMVLTEGILLKLSGIFLTATLAKIERMNKLQI